MVFKRNNFKSGTILQPKPNASTHMPMKKRGLDPQGVLRRPSFKRTGPSPRKSKTIQEIQDLRTKQEGVKIRFGDSKIGKLKVIKRDAHGQPILNAAGQPVTEEKDFNFGLLAELVQGSSTDNITKLGNLDTLIRSGATASSAERNNIAIILGQILSNIDNLKNINNNQFRTIASAIAQLNIPNDPVLANIPGLVDRRFITDDTWKAGGGENKGIILMFLISNAQFSLLLTASRPIFGLNGNPMQISSIDGTMSRTTARNPQPTMDLIAKRIYPSLQDARRAVGITTGATVEVEEEKKAAPVTSTALVPQAAAPGQPRQIISPTFSTTPTFPPLPSLPRVPRDFSASTAPIPPISFQDLSDLSAQEIFGVVNINRTRQRLLSERAGQP